METETEYYEKQYYDDLEMPSESEPTIELVPLDEDPEPTTVKC